MKAVRQLLEFVTARDYGTEGAGVGRETYVFSWNPERFVSQWWHPYLDAVGLNVQRPCGLHLSERHRSGCSH